MKSLACAARAVVMLLCLSAGVTHASVIVSATRVVFLAQDGDVTVRLSNDDARPALVEAWMDKGDIHSTPDKVDVPFLITPPLFRMEPHKDQSLRIIGTPSTLPLDRESLFWLNVLEIPPKPNTVETRGKNTLQFAIRSRLKFFYRPAHLPGDPLKAAAAVTWQTAADGTGYVLIAHNPTPYHITFNVLAVTVGGTRYEADTGMIEPLGTLRLPIKGLSRSPAGAPVAYYAINDYGATVAYKGSVTP